MGYKLINAKFKTGDTSLNRNTYPHTWVQRLCQFNNFTLASETPTTYYYYGLLNDGKIAVGNNKYSSDASTSGLYIGLPKWGSGSYYCYGFAFIFSTNQFGDYDGCEFKMVVDDDNNLVFHSGLITKQSNWSAEGFLVTNGGYMISTKADVYAPSVNQGDTPAKIAEFPYGNGTIIWHSNKGDFDILRSNALGYDANDNVIIRDHLQVLMSANKNMIVDMNAADRYKLAFSNVFEIITVDEEMYMHIFENLWIKIDEILEEEIEAVNI